MKKTLGKIAQTYLIFGTGEGPARITLSNWTGLAYRIPRINLDSFEDCDELKHSGIYFLISQDDELTGEVYVGKVSKRANGNSVLQRIKEHGTNENKTFTDIVFLTTSDDTLGPSELAYLENKIYNEIKKIGRYSLTNSSEPSVGGKITPLLSDPMDEYINNAKVLINMLGYNFFTPINTIIESLVDTTADKTIFYYNITKYGESRPQAVYNEDGTMTVLKGSRVKPKSEYPNYIGKNIINIYDELSSKGDLENNVLIKNITFNSPSTASSFVGGASSNGWNDWRDKKGNSLNQIIGR